MRVHRFESVGTGPARLLPMQGFYLLHLPMGQVYPGFHQCFVGAQQVLVADHMDVVLVPVSFRVARLLLKLVRRHHQPDQWRYVAILTAGSLEGLDFRALSVARLRPLAEMEEWVGKGALEHVSHR